MVEHLIRAHMVTASLLDLFDLLVEPGEMALDAVALRGIGAANPRSLLLAHGHELIAPAMQGG